MYIINKVKELGREIKNSSERVIKMYIINKLKEIKKYFAGKYYEAKVIKLDFNERKNKGKILEKTIDLIIEDLDSLLKKKEEETLVEIYNNLEVADDIDTKINIPAPEEV